MPDSEALATVRKTLQDYLTEIFGNYQVDQDGDFMVVHPLGSSVAYIRALDWGDGQTIVRVWAITNVGMRVDGDLARFLASENNSVVFGAFALNEDKPAVHFGHTLLGDFLQRKELEVAVAAVVTTADHYDDQIKERFGGKLFKE